LSSRNADGSICFVLFVLFFDNCSFGGLFERERKNQGISKVCVRIVCWFFFARSEKGGLKKKTNKQKLNKNLKKKFRFLFQWKSTGR
jgi:hypothetical protein